MTLCDDPGRLFVPGEYCVRRASEAWERSGHFRLRHDVFCTEQGIFPNDDRDDTDAAAIAIVALTCVLGEPDHVVGTVRIVETSPGEWHGSRLAVQRGFRRLGGLGAALIRSAVGVANANGARCFRAHVQPQNVALFERLHWRSLGEIQIHDRPHHLMQVDLSHYPPCDLPENRMVVQLQHAA